MHLYEAFVDAFLINELVVGAALPDVALLQHHDLVGMLHGREAVGNDDAGAVLHEFVDGILHDTFTFGVE